MTEEKRESLTSRAARKAVQRAHETELRRAYHEAADVRVTYAKIRVACAAKDSIIQALHRRLRERTAMLAETEGELQKALSENLRPLTQEEANSLESPLSARNLTLAKVARIAKERDDAKANADQCHRAAWRDREECDKAKADNKALSEELEAIGKLVGHQEDESYVEAAKRRMRQLSAAIDVYGDHTKTCAQGCTVDGKRQACSCGWESVAREAAESSRVSGEDAAERKPS